jgi:hypothetical protein
MIWVGCSDLSPTPKTLPTHNLFVTKLPRGVNPANRLPPHSL